MTVGKRLQQAMRAAQMSQYGLAKKSGVPQPTIARIISGETKEPKRTTMDRLAAALNLAAESLYNNRIQESAAEYQLLHADGLQDEVAIKAFLGLSPADRARVRAIIQAFTNLDAIEDTKH